MSFFKRRNARYNVPLLPGSPEGSFIAKAQGCDLAATMGLRGQEGQETFLLRQPVTLLLDGVRNQVLVAVIPCVDMLLCESIIEDMFSFAVGLRRIEIGIRLSACGVKDWILVSAQITERLFIEENALQFTVVGQQELSRERLQFSHGGNLQIRPQIPLLAAVRLRRLPQQPQRNYRFVALGRIAPYIPKLSATPMAPKQCLL
jgi:hypothetical protein